MKSMHQNETITTPVIDVSDVSRNEQDMEITLNEETNPNIVEEEVITESVDNVSDILASDDESPPKKVFIVLVKKKRVYWPAAVNSEEEDT